MKLKETQIILMTLEPFSKDTEHNSNIFLTSRIFSGASNCAIWVQKIAHDQILRELWIVLKISAEKDAFFSKY